MTTTTQPIKFELPFEDAVCVPMNLLQLDKDNPRLQIGEDVTLISDEDIIKSLSDIAVLDELVTSICTNKYLNLEPMIVIGENNVGPFRVLEGNRRLAAIKLICNPELAKKVGVKIPEKIHPSVFESIKEILAFRVHKEEDSRAFIGFKHINGPQRWDAYAKARYVTDWYKSSFGKISISEMADKMGDNNNTLRSYIYSLLILEQAESAGIWTIKDRANNGRFAFSHFYTALGRKEYQEFLDLADGWSDTPPLEPLDNKKLAELGEVLGYVYGSRSDDRPALVRSQNPDLKNVGLAIANTEARLVLKNRGTLEEALDVIKDPSDAFYDAIIQANIKIARAIKLMPKYAGGKMEVDNLVDEIFEQADTLKTMNDKKKKKIT